MLNGSQGEYHFCRFCESESTCDKSWQKITQRSMYVLRYIYEFESGVCIYPFPGSWECQPHWFSVMFTEGRAEMNRIRIEKAKQEAEKARHRK